MADSGNTGLNRILKATVYSWQGLKASYRNEEAFRQELMLAVILIPLGLYLGEGAVEKVLLITSVLLLLLVEVLNSAIEAVVDRFGGEQHELSGRAKDMGSAAVFIAIAIVVLTWVVILLFPA
jgi:diacylglycerol kinase (ATP)